VWEERGGLMLKRDEAAPTQLSANGRAATMAAMPGWRRRHRVGNARRCDHCGLHSIARRGSRFVFPFYAGRRCRSSMDCSPFGELGPSGLRGFGQHSPDPAPILGGLCLDARPAGGVGGRRTGMERSVPVLSENRLQISNIEM